MLLSVSLSGWTKQRDGLAFVAPVHVKIAVNREHNMPWMQLAHKDEAHINEIWLTVA